MLKRIDQVNLRKDIKDKLEYINMTMDRFLPRKDDYPKEIHKAIRHSLFAGGKRIRPYLTVLVYLLYKPQLSNEILKAAAAIEFLHTYTLIHDDLPEIDNDDFRRGKKTCHVVFGSDVALLAGDALLIEAINMVNNIEISPAKRMKMVREMTILCGDKGLIAGQMQDILSEKSKCTKEVLEFIHLNKTAKLIQLCTRWGAFLADTPNTEVKKMDEFGKTLGLAFQIVDDILDVEGSSAAMGKTLGKDIYNQKSTFPSVVGMKQSKEMAGKLTETALNMLSEYGTKAKVLVELTQYLLERKT